MKLLDLAGMRFGRLVVISRAPNGIGGVRWNCKCDCGTDHVAHAGDISRKKFSTKSCGCRKHFGRFKGEFPTSVNGKMTTLYVRWIGMLSRCYYKRAVGYKNYGGRGIVVCKRWHGHSGYQRFCKDMGQPPDGLTLDRKNVNGNYTKRNCRWATYKQQANNTRKQLIRRAAKKK